MSGLYLNIWMGVLMAAVVATVMFPLTVTLSSAKARWLGLPMLVLIVLLWAATFVLAFIHYFGSNP